MKLNPFIKLYDGFQNVMKGLGGERDSRQYRRYVETLGRVDQHTAEMLYASNWLTAKVVDVPVEDALRKWREILIEDSEKKEEVEKFYKETKLKSTIDTAAKWSRVFGGSGIFIVIEGDDPTTPLYPERVRPGTLKRFVALDRWRLTSLGVNTDLLSENFGEPEFYTEAESGTIIHHTRIVKFNGPIPSINLYRINNYWGDSIFRKLYDPISDSQNTSNAISTMIDESNVDVYKIEGLNQLIAEGGDELAIKRLKIAHEMKSIVNGIALDASDGYEKKSNSFATLDAIDDRFIQKVAGASNIPVTKLLGISPGGQNATGESDLRNYYDSVSDYQENKLRSKLEYIDSITARSLGLEPFEFNWLPLMQLNEIEQATVENTRADRDTKYLNAGVIEVSDIQAELAQNKTYVSVDMERAEETREYENMEMEEEEYSEIPETETPEIEQP